MYWVWCGAAGLATGVLNGTFGSGGGLVAVLLLKRLLGDSRRAHATSVAITLFLSAFSAWAYLREGAASLSDALPYLPGGIVGALLGGTLLKRIELRWLRRLFALVLLYAAVRMFLS